MTELTLWDYAIQERDRLEKAVKSGKTESLLPVESTLIVVGSKECGKSSLISRYLDRDETPKPTTALDYIFARKPKEHGTGKDVCHIWELGGGTSMTELLEYTINPHNLRTLSCLLVLDISKPSMLWKTLETLLNETRERLEDAIKVGEKADPGLRAYLAEKAAQRIGANHPDINLLSLFPVPLAIVGSCFDLYQELEEDKKIMICNTLRFIAHLNGAMLMFYSTKADGHSNKGRLLLGKLAFDLNLSKSVVSEHGKPVFFPFGQDSMESIGAPPIAPENLLRVKSGTPYDLWKGAFSEVFPQDTQDKSQKIANLAQDPQYAEAAVDSMRAQKDEELERYRKMAERKAMTSSTESPTKGRPKKK